MHVLQSIQLYQASIITAFLAMFAGCSDSAANQNDGTPPVTNASESAAPLSPASATASMNTPFIMPLINAPETYQAGEVQIPDDAEIIGVVEQDHAIAYLCIAMSSMGSHVINDIVGKRPIAVTFCDRTADVCSGL